MNSSGLIYAVIVGAWAAYLVPMWLRRQDELNESRPTERFSTAIRLLSGKAAMERRYAKGTDRRDGELPDDGDDFADPFAEPGHAGRDGVHAAAADGAPDEEVDVRAYADPKTMVEQGGTGAATEVLPGGAAERRGAGTGDEGRRDDPARSRRGAGNARAKVLARRRRTTMVLFLAFTAGTVVAGVGGVTYLWVPAGPGLLLSAYIIHLRVQERRRFAAVMDKRRVEGPHGQPAGDEGGSPQTEVLEDAGEVDAAPEAAAPQAAARPAEEPAAAGRRALVEQTDHAEWVDQQRQGAEATESWDPVPVPLPTYVSAPVAPRTTRGVDLEEPDIWSSARSSTAGGELPSGDSADEGPATGARRGRGTGRTPLFDQFEGEERPRAANE